MPISAKYKRKLNYRGKTYYWYIAPAYDEMYLTGNMLRLHIIAEDSSWSGCFPLDSCVRSEERFAVYRAPVPVPDAVTPDTVRRLIEAYDKSKE